MLFDFISVIRIGESGTRGLLSTLEGSVVTKFELSWMLAPLEIAFFTPLHVPRRALDRCVRT